jgi:sucrose-6-phosphate hydrolase SacC (GH32 family)
VQLFSEAQFTTGDAECPNFFEIPLDGDPQNKRWVFYGASGVYVVGKFDGHAFTPETAPRRLQNGNCWYASQVYSDIPPADGRSILIPWGRLPSDDIFRGETFNQMMGLPVELTLHSSPSGPVLEVNPVRELASLRQQTHEIAPQPLMTGENPLAGIHGDLFEIKADLVIGTAKQITFNLRGFPVTYDVASQKLSCAGCEAVLAPVGGKISLHLFVDRRSVDIFGDHGRLYLPMASALSPENHSLQLSCQGGTGSIVLLKVYELKSAWQQ